MRLGEIFCWKWAKPMSSCVYLGPDLAQQHSALLSFSKGSGPIPASDATLPAVAMTFLG